VIWLNPAAWIAIASVAAPVLIHLLVHRRAERFAFPTLRFIQPTPLAAIRRRVLEDIALLAVRAAIIGAAVAACAGPLVVTPARRAVWNARIVRATVVDRRVDVAVPPQEQRGNSPFRTQRFDAASLSDGIHRAVAWLDAAPPARRELVVAGRLTIGSVADADIAGVPAGVGIRFERMGTLPAERSVAGSPLIGRAGSLRRTITLSGSQTSVLDEPAAAAAVLWPVEIVAPVDARPAVDAAIDAVLSQRVWKPAPDRRVRLIVLDRSGRPSTTVDAEPIRLSWMADAVARIARDAELHDEADRTAADLVDRRFVTAPWQPLLAGADGRPMISAAASSGTLTVVSAADTVALVTPLLLRAIVNSVAPAEDAAQWELLPISDGQLRAWSRPPASVPAPRIDTVDRDDRRWLSGAVLMLIAAEAWMRRARHDAADAVDREAARVA
jgi:hypothetical protein